jgi:uncharacterized protein HemY
LLCFWSYCYILSKKLKTRIRLMKSITDDYVSTRTRSKARLEMNKAVMSNAHEEGGDWTSSERLASDFLTLGIAGSARAVEAGEDEIETINGPEDEPAT